VASKLMKSVSGIRGVVGETFTPELILQVCSAYSKYIKKGTVVIGRDTRPTGDAVTRGIESALSLCGCDVINIGIVPTPTVEIMVRELKAAGGIIVTASHNPVEWNAFKLLNSNGTFLNSKQMNRIFEYMEEDFKYPAWNKIGCITCNDDGAEVHINRVLKAVDTSKIKRKKFKVVLDSVNGAGSVITQQLLSIFGCKTVPLYCDINSGFPRGTEPVPSNLKDLSKAVMDAGADIGFAQDPDADRLAIVNEKGEPIGEEYTLALVAEHLLSKKKGRVVVNLSTTKAIEDIAVKYGVPFKRTKVGEINVVEEMMKKGARIGGEGNGGVISPEINPGRDSLAGIGYILEMMTERKKSVSELVAELPAYVMKKGKVKFDADSYDGSTLEKIKKEFSSEKISEIDGLRIDFIKTEPFLGGWVHLRPSNTEPVFRIIAEAPDQKTLSRIYRYFSGIFNN